MGEVLLVLPGGSYLHFCVHVFQGHWKGEAKGQYMYMLDLGGGGSLMVGYRGRLCPEGVPFFKLTVY